MADAALQFREVNGAIKPYLIDVGSANGTFVNKQRIKPNEFVPRYSLSRYSLLARNV